METLGFLIKNRKGFYTSNARKVYFPDKRNKYELEEGIICYDITKDLDSYGFFIGKMVKGVGTLSDAIEAGKIDLSSVTNIYKLGDYEFWISQQSSGFSVFAYIDNEVVEFEFSDSTEQEKFNKQKFCSSLLGSSKRINLHTIQCKYINEFVNSLPDIKSREELLEAVLNNIGDYFPDNIKLYDNKVVCFNGKYSTRYYQLKGGSLRLLPNAPDISLFNDVEDLTEEIKSFILDNNIVVSASKDIFISKTISCFNNELRLDFMPTGGFTFSKFNTFKSQLEDSKQRLLDFKKSVGKYINKSNMSELQKLNKIKDWQLGGNI